MTLLAFLVPSICVFPVAILIVVYLQQFNLTLKQALPRIICFAVFYGLVGYSAETYLRYLSSL